MSYRPSNVVRFGEKTVLDFAQHKENPTGRVPQQQKPASNVAYGDCVGCGGSADDDEMIRIGLEMWHSRCVFCVKCKRHCVSNYIEIGGIIYCPKDVPATSTVNVPEPQLNLGRQVCGGCQLPIDKLDYNTVFAMGVDWHEKCFVCTVCKQPFEGGTFYFEGSKLLCATHAGIKK